MQSFALLLSAFALLSVALADVTAASDAAVEIRRLPEGGVQPQVVVDTHGVLHAVYLSGDPKSADVFYVRSQDWARTFSEPRRVNSLAGSATAAGAIRGAQLAAGRGGRVHVAWNGSSLARPRAQLNPEMPSDSPHNGTPMLYSRLGDDGLFEPQRNLMTRTFGLDGGGSIAADAEGHVYVAWHAKKKGARNGEAGRRVWLARSMDDGKHFAAERPAFKESTGACGCCGMRIFANSSGALFGLYRSARDVVHRDIYLLASADHGKTFDGRMLHPWEIGACPMSSMFLSEGSSGLLAAWETEHQVFFSKVDPESLEASIPLAAPGESEHRKYPVLAQNREGQTLLVGIEVKSRAKPGALRWSLFDMDGKFLDRSDQAAAVPASSFAAAFARPDGFTVLY